MYKIIVSLYALNRLDIFLNYMKAYYFNKFKDSGLFNAEEIISGHLKSLNLFKGYLISSINKVLSSEVIAKKIISKDEVFEKYYTYLHIRSYDIKLTCLQNNIEKIIVVEDIDIRT